MDSAQPRSLGKRLGPSLVHSRISVAAACAVAIEFTPAQHRLSAAENHQSHLPVHRPERLDRYERVGDLVAFDLDAVMATFPTPDRAVAAALCMREAMGASSTATATSKSAFTRGPEAPPQAWPRAVQSGRRGNRMSDCKVMPATCRVGLSSTRPHASQTRPMLPARISPSTRRRSRPCGEWRGISRDRSH